LPDELSDILTTKSHSEKSKTIDIESLNSPGFQLVNILVKQIDGCLEVKSGKYTEFTILFNNIEA